jgi:hypothetical protein
METPAPFASHALSRNGQPAGFLGSGAASSDVPDMGRVLSGHSNVHGILEPSREIVAALFVGD